jgi:hypothetical protein
VKFGGFTVALAPLTPLDLPDPTGWWFDQQFYLTALNAILTVRAAGGG